jgi:SAM-dependent methyltransferase
MSNPWLDIPLADYEGHMTSAEVQQLGALSDLFAEAIAFSHPASVAVLGVAGGNGLERIDSKMTARVVGLDVNPLYLDAVRRRYSHVAGLELHCIDLAEQVIELQPVQLVHAALVFEHAGVGRCLDNAISLVADGGALSVVLQLPAKAGQDVGRGGFASMQKLAPHFSLIDPMWLRKTLEERAFRLVCEARRSLPAGKEFWMGIFVRE